MEEIRKAKYERILRLLDNQIQNVNEIINFYDECNVRTPKYKYEEILETKKAAFFKVNKRLLTL